MKPGPLGRKVALASASVGCLLAVGYFALGWGDANERIWGTWTIQQATVDGNTVLPDQRSTWQFVEEGSCPEPMTACKPPYLRSTGMCNEFVQELHGVNGREMAFGDSTWSTRAICGSGMSQAIDELRRGAGFTFEVRGDRLVIEGEKDIEVVRERAD
jgi:hypothetical protein